MSQKKPVSSLLPSEQQITSRWQKPWKEPAVSVCCSTFEHEKYLEQTIEGVLAQITDFPYELIIHDDASKDGTLGIARHYQSLYPQIITVIEQEQNMFSQGHRIIAEFLLPAARGEYIALCEGDDFWNDPLKLQQQFDFLEANSDFSICYADAIGLQEDTGKEQVISGVRWDLTAFELQCTASIFTLTTMFRNVISNWPKELSRAPYGDLLLWSLLGDYGKGKYLPDIKPSTYRIHSRGLHSMQAKQRRANMSIETLMVLYLFRNQRQETRLALANLANVIVLAAKAHGKALFKDIISRAWRKKVRNRQ